MDYQADQQCDFSDVVETLCSMFGNVLSEEVILTVVESCGGDLSLAAEAVMSITSDGTNEPAVNPAFISDLDSAQPVDATEIMSNTHNPPVPQQTEVLNTQCTATPSQPMSYTAEFRSTGAVPKQIPNPPKITPKGAEVWTDQLRLIITHHNNGSRILIFMRGVPGCGKSYLAKQIVEMTIGATFVDYKTHICSTDDYFMGRGVYKFDRFRLSEAHDWNQNRVRAALRQGLSPIIVDNTNIEIWEMEPYLSEGVKNGYIIEVVEPKTPWARKANQLLRKTTHNVPITTIKRMLDNYKGGITGDFLCKKYGLSYPTDKVPPVLRTIPAVSNLQSRSESQSTITTDTETSSILYIPLPEEFNQKVLIVNQTNDLKNLNQNEQRIACTNEKQEQDVSPIMSENVITAEELSNDSQEEVARQKRDLEIEKQLQEMEKVEKEWENGESWDEVSQNTASSSNNHSPSADPKPPRRNKALESTPKPTDNILETVQKCEDWRQISLFLPAWNDESSIQQSKVADIPAQTISSSTSVDVGDTDMQSPRKVLKVITAIPRDINLFHVSFNREKIPEKRMLDKSTMTNELIITEAYRCKNEEQHFVAFRKLFKNISKVALRDVFDKCCGDVNWAVDIILESVANNQLKTLDDEDISDAEEENLEQCNCLAAYNIVPDTLSPVSTESASSRDNIPDMESTILPQRKTKIIPSDNSLQLKRQIEKNFVISDDHYSKHSLKVRKTRRGEYFPNIDQHLENNPVESPEIDKDDNTPSTSTAEVSSCLKTNDSADEESNTSSTDEVEKTVNINVGHNFLNQLDDLFGRKGMTYPENVVPRISIPLSLLNEINAFWMESLMHQLDEQDKQNARMLQEDQEFARQLALKEAELEQAGKEPEVPDFKEIMDMDFAISLYQKDVAEWRNRESNDLAAKLTRDKLCNLFPDTSPDILSELLMAHDNNFQVTVEVLLMSTGKTDILEEKNGLNKFVMKKEMERQEKLLEKEHKTLSEVEWPLLPKGEKVEMSVVDDYRSEAEKHLVNRNTNYQKAQDYIRRGMTQVANYYSDIAAFHKRKYEQANSLAAITLMQVHASNSPNNATIDLHYLRVGEARESLDLFLDTHIQKLKETQYRGPRCHTLFFITGRGLHSIGRPRVKPAVKKRLRERGLTFSERNPGLLTAKVCADDKLAHQVQVP